MLNQFGFNGDWQRKIEKLNSGDIPARIISVSRGQADLQTAEGLVCGSLAAKLTYEDPASYPASGDWVACRMVAPKQALVTHLLKRETCLWRKRAGQSSLDQVLAANMDWVCLATSANEEFNPRRIERYLAMIWESGAKPLILLTKTDLVPEPASYLLVLQEIAAHIPTLAVSAQTGRGLEALANYIAEGQTAALIGSSGVGKSTLINGLAAQALQKTKAISNTDAKGRHTTSNGRLILLPWGGILIDTPGLREIQLANHGDGIGQAFPEIAELAQACRFRNCRHGGEPGCAVTEGLDQGTIQAERLANYHKLIAENSRLAQNSDKVLTQRKKQQHKSQSKLLRKRLTRKYR